MCSQRVVFSQVAPCSYAAWWLVSEMLRCPINMPVLCCAAKLNDALTGLICGPHQNNWEPKW